jgi:hypothetical protein
MTANVRSLDFLPTHLFLRAVLGGLMSGVIAVAGAGCAAKPVCSSDDDCGPGYLCIDKERCVLNPRGPRSDAGSGGPDSGVDATPGPDSSVQPSSCNSETDVFEPGQVYLLGSLSGVTCAPSAIASLKEPALESVGFPCGIDRQSVVIRPSDGRLLYLDTMAKKVRAFARDQHPYDTGQDACRYPDNPTANDVDVPTTACDNSGGPADFRLAPDLEGIWYTCANTPGLWFDENDAQIGFLGGSTPLARGYGGSVLATQGSVGDATAASLELYNNGSQVDLVDPAQEGGILAVRVLDDGYHVVVQGDGEGSGQIVIIGVDGSISSGAAYPSLPADVSLDVAGAGRAVDADGTLYVAVFDNRAGAGSRAVVELEPGLTGAATVVYSEADEPEVGPVSAVLVTGL